ncbi:MAG TPA: hypothetical protein VME24_00675, partial [Alphaproteobacteria bacterium]|nr:hypothetical protein [Alphaproteobacteria bacterium]
MPFSAPDTDIQFDLSAKGGFTAPPTDRPVKGFLAPDTDVAQWEAARQATLNASIDPTAFAEGGVNQASQYGSGYSADPPNLLNADDWGFTAALAGPSGPPALAGKALNFAGQALKGDAESMLFAAAGDKEDSNQQLTAAAEKMMPSMVARDRALGIPGNDPYKDAQATLPNWQQIASSIAPGLIETSPQTALAAVQPEIGAFSLGLTPEGFDPLTTASMMIAPGGGKMIGGIAEKVATKAGIGNAQALDVINRLGGGAGVASLISTPAAYQIAQMQPGPERNEAIQNVAANSILTGILGSIGAREGLPENSVSTALPTLTPTFGQIESLPAAAEDPAGALWDKLLGQNQQMVNATPDVDQVIRSVFPVEEQAAAIPDKTTQYYVGSAGVRDPGLNDDTATTPQTRTPEALEIPGHETGPAFSLSGGSDLTPSQSQQIIQKAINEKHATAAKIQGASEGQYQWNNDELRSAKSTFGELLKANQQTIGNAVHDQAFYKTEIAQTFRALAAQFGADVGFFKGDKQSPRGFFHDGTLWMRSNRPLPEIIRTFEHEMVHHQADESAHIAALKNDVDLQSPVAREILDEYNPWRIEKGLRPLSHDAAREEVVAHFLAGDTRYGDLSTAFNNPDAAVKLAQDYHASEGSAGSAGGQKPDLSFEPGQVGETGRERAPPLKGNFDEDGTKVAPGRSQALPNTARQGPKNVASVVPEPGRNQLTATSSREWGKYDLRRVPVGSDPIPLSKSFPKSETPITHQGLPKTSDGLQLWATHQLAKLPGVVRSPWGNEVVLRKGNDLAPQASHYISGGAGFGPSHDRAAALPMLANTVRNAMARATVRGRPWSAYLYRYAGGQLHVVLVNNDSGAVERQFVAKQDPRDPNFQSGSDLRVLYRNGIEGKPGETLSPPSADFQRKSKASVTPENTARPTNTGKPP